MSETALQNALARRERLLQELERLDAFIELYHELSRNRSADNGVDIVVSTGDGRRAYVQAKSYQRVMHRVRPKSLAPIVREILVERGRPMTRTQLTEALKARGLNMPSADEARYLGTVLWRHRDEFVNIDGEGYWPRDLLCVEVGYIPEEPEHIKEARLLGPPERAAAE
jgi:hypothetical protein